MVEILGLFNIPISIEGFAVITALIVFGSLWGSIYRMAIKSLQEKPNIDEVSHQ